MSLLAYKSCSEKGGLCYCHAVQNFRQRWDEDMRVEVLKDLAESQKHSNFSTLWAYSLIVHHRLASPDRAPCRFEDPTHWTAH